VDDWLSKERPGDWIGKTKHGDFTIDDAQYTVYQNLRGDLIQYFSLRKEARDCGTIDISAHFDQWEKLGMKMGTLDEAKVLAEIGNGNGGVTGTVDFSYAKVYLGDSSPAQSEDQPQNQPQDQPQGQPQGALQDQPQGLPQVPSQVSSHGLSPDLQQNQPQSQPQGLPQGQQQDQPQGPPQNPPQGPPQGLPQGQQQEQLQGPPQNPPQGQQQDQPQGPPQDQPQWQQQGQLQNQSQGQQNTFTGGNCAGAWAQCGGEGFSGPNCCNEGTCTQINQYYHQCKL